MNKTSSPTPTRFPLILSALVFPGVGQIAQKRLVSGILFILAFTGGAAVFLVRTIYFIYLNLNTAISMASGDTTAEFVEMELNVILIPLGVTMAIYVLNIMDAAWYARKVSNHPDSESDL